MLVTFFSFHLTPLISAAQKQVSHLMLSVSIQGSIPIVLTNNGLTTLVDAVVKAGLAEALSNPGKLRNVSKISFELQKSMKYLQDPSLSLRQPITLSPP